MELKSFSDLKEKKCRLSVLWEILCKIKSKSGRAVPFPNDLLFIANNGYKVVFELFDGDIKISQIEKKFIVK